MARHFFTGGMMPSDDLFLHVQDELAIEDHWRLERAALPANGGGMAGQSGRAARGGGPRAGRRLWRRRGHAVAGSVAVFLMACAEMFGYRGGTEWIVSHYLFRRRA